MFDTLTDKLKNVFSKLTGKSQLSEENISEAVSEVRLALLEADVNYAVTKTLVKKIKEKAVGEKLIKSVTPGQQFIKIVHDELVELMGAKESELNFAGSPPVFMLCGLQGAGKTTHAAKIAAYLKAHKKVAAPLLVACDRQRPAAIDQLKTLAAQIGVPVFDIPGEADPIKVARGRVDAAVKRA